MSNSPNLRTYAIELVAIATGVHDIESQLYRDDSLIHLSHEGTRSIYQADPVGYVQDILALCRRLPESLCTDRDELLEADFDSSRTGARVFMLEQLAITAATALSLVTDEEILEAAHRFWSEHYGADLPIFRMAGCA